MQRAVALMTMLSISACGPKAGPKAGSGASSHPEIGPLPELDAGDPELVELGKTLFFDTKLSGDASMSCATCHDPEKGWTDGVALGTAYPDSLGIRNTKTIINAMHGEVFYWDGRLSKGDRDTQVRDMITETHYLNMDGRLMLERLKQVPEYVDDFTRLLGGEPSFGRTLKAVAAFQTSLVSENAPFDTGEMSPEARRGMRLITGKAGCIECHNGPYFSDGQPHETGAPENPSLWEEPRRHFTLRSYAKFMGVDNFERLGADPGFYVVSKEDEDFGKFVTPTLRELTRTAPYMHSGMLETLEDVVAFYDAGEGEELEPLNLSDTNRTDLVAFLESLSGDDLAIEIPEVPDYQIIKDWYGQDN